MVVFRESGMGNAGCREQDIPAYILEMAQICTRRQRLLVIRLTGDPATLTIARLEHSACQHLKLQGLCIVEVYRLAAL